MLPFAFKQSKYYTKAYSLSGIVVRIQFDACTNEPSGEIAAPDRVGIGFIGLGILAISCLEWLHGFNGYQSIELVVLSI